MYINKNTRKYFNKFDNKIFDLINIGDLKEKIKVYGTYSEPLYANYSSDVDTKKFINMNNFQQFMDEFRRLINKLNDSETLGLISVQVANERATTKQEIKRLMGKPDSYFLRLLLNQDKIKNKKSFFDKKFIKLDFWVWRGAYIKDMSIVYIFEPQSDEKPPTKQEVIQDIEKFIKKGDYFKSLKRLKLIRPSRKLDNYLLNNELGTLYIIINKLDSLTNDTIPMKYKKISLQNMKNDVRKIGNLTNNLIPLFDDSSIKSIEKIRDILKKRLNSEAKKFWKSR